MSYAWSTAIGLQQVDGRTPSDYLLGVAKKNIEGKIFLDYDFEREREFKDNKNIPLNVPLT